VAALIALGVVIIVLMSPVPASASQGGPVAVSGQQIDGKVVVSWLPPEGPSAVIVQAGCECVNMSMSGLGQNFTSLYPNITMMLRGGGNIAGFAVWAPGGSEIVQASRALTDQEMEAARAKGINVTETRICVESVAVIVDPLVGIDEVTIDQLKRLLDGSVSNWREIGGADLKVRVFLPSQTESPFLFINGSVMGGAPFVGSATTIYDGEALANRVANTSGAVGIIRAGPKGPSAGVSCLAVKNASGSKSYRGNDIEAAYNGSYVLSRYYRLYANGPFEGAAAAWAAFVLHPQYGQRLLAENGFLPLKGEDRESYAKNIGMTSPDVGYRVVRRSSDGTSSIFNVSTTQLIDANVTAGMSYVYTVSVRNGSEHVASASPITVTVSLPDEGPGSVLKPPASTVVLVLASLGLVSVAISATLMLFRRR